MGVERQRPLVGFQFPALDHFTNILDSHSRELLTWALVKEAQPGDRVVALHILTNNGILDRDGKSSLLSLVNSFDSVLVVYEGFCNLKQVLNPEASTHGSGGWRKGLEEVEFVAEGRAL
ncbi:hypothetical protein L6452_26200 [Arctium lappa]|uniref:Uncharacterized protein n=1 Tax=Arctium lappa TaxID=4217 RepID=A0ACB9AD83_ARCLA|nr:hypothetical protein L6452_26200 [Arctium lappa]